MFVVLMISNPSYFTPKILKMDIYTMHADHQVKSNDLGKSLPIDPSISSWINSVHNKTLIPQWYYYYNT